MQLNEFLQTFKPTKTTPASAEVVASYKGIIPESLRGLANAWIWEIPRRADRAYQSWWFQRYARYVAGQACIVVGLVDLVISHTTFNPSRRDWTVLFFTAGFTGGYSHSSPLDLPRVICLLLLQSISCSYEKQKLPECSFLLRKTGLNRGSLLPCNPGRFSCENHKIEDVFWQNWKLHQRIQ